MSKQLEVIGFAYIQSTGETVAIDDMTPVQRNLIARAINRQFAKGYAQRNGYSIKFDEELPKWAEVQ